MTVCGTHVDEAMDIDDITEYCKFLTKRKNSYNNTVLIPDSESCLEEYKTGRKVEQYLFEAIDHDLLVHDCAADLIQIIKSYDIPLSFFRFEITETAATQLRDVSINSIDIFVKNGIKLIMDDFGAGFANLNAVLKLPFSAIKFDRSMLAGITEVSKEMVFYKNMVTSLQQLGYLIVSEGVETKNEFEILKNWGVDMIQGYYFSKPLSCDEFLKVISKQ